MEIEIKNEIEINKAIDYKSTQINENNHYGLNNDTLRDKNNPKLINYCSTKGLTDKQKQIVKNNPKTLLTDNSLLNEYNGNNRMLREYSKDRVNKVITTKTTILKHNTKDILKTIKENAKINLNKNVILRDKKNKNLLLELKITKDNLLKSELPLTTGKSYEYYSNKHKPKINAYVFNINGVNPNRDKNNKIKELPIKTLIHTYGYNYLLPNNENAKNLNLSLNISEKIITLRNTDIGLTDNISTFNRCTECLGYPFKRVHFTKSTVTSKDKIEHEGFKEIPLYIYDRVHYKCNKCKTIYKNPITKCIKCNSKVIPYLYHKEKKYLLDNMFCTRVLKLYFNILSNILKTKDNGKTKVKNIRALTIKNNLKSIKGKTLLIYLKTIRSWIITNKPKTTRKNNTYKFNLELMDYYINLIRNKGFLGYYTIKIDKHLSKTNKDRVKLIFIDKEYKLTSKTNRFKLSDRNIIPIDSLDNWVIDNLNINGVDSKTKINNNFNYL